MSPKLKSSNVGSSDIPKSSGKVLLLTEKIHMYRRKHSICRVWYYLRFQASTGNLGMYPPRMREDDCTIQVFLKYGLCAGGFPRLWCLRRSLFSVLQRPSPFILIFIPDNTLEGGRAGFIVFPLSMRTDVTQGRVPAEGECAFPALNAIFFPLSCAGGRCYKITQVL